MELHSSDTMSQKIVARGYENVVNVIDSAPFS